MNLNVFTLLFAVLIIKIAICTLSAIFYIILKLGLQFQFSINPSSVFLCFINLLCIRLSHTITDIRFLLAGKTS